MDVRGMAEAHLQTVQRTVVDLEKQKANIQEEIAKLNEYLKQGVEELNKNNETAPQPDSKNGE